MGRVQKALANDDFLKLKLKGGKSKSSRCGEEEWKMPAVTCCTQIICDHRKGYQRDLCALMQQLDSLSHSLSAAYVITAVIPEATICIFLFFQYTKRSKITGQIRWVDLCRYFCLV